jgi:hypothetical protein
MAKLKIQKPGEGSREVRVSNDNDIDNEWKNVVTLVGEKSN